MFIDKLLSLTGQVGGWEACHLDLCVHLLDVDNYNIDKYDVITNEYKINFSHKQTNNM